MTILAPSPHTIPYSKEDLPQWLQSFLDREEPESDALDYKSGSGFHKLKVPKEEEEAKNELTRDICSMANSAGGLILHGVDEVVDEFDIARPTKLSPVPISIMKEETLSQIVKAIEPRIDGLKIVAIEPMGSPGLQCFAIEIPQSSTIHQSRDRRYFRRVGSTKYPMPDHQIREALNRQIFPKIRVWGYLESGFTLGNSWELKVEVENIGATLCRDYFVQLTLPYYIRNFSNNFPFEILNEPREIVETPEGMGVRLGFTGNGTVLHPGMRHTKRFTLQGIPSDDFVYRGILPNTHFCLLRVFADSAPPYMRWFMLDAFRRKDRPTDSWIEEMSEPAIGEF